MRLWNDYEGKIIAGLFPVEKLIRPEGRSAFFTTKNGSGKPAVLRLIEAINDETEILERWKAVAALNQTHLITFKQCGQTVIDGTPLIYAVMEPTVADLSEILQERTLSVDETRQVATSLVDALRSLHGSGFIHEHVEPANVLATSDHVKLRSDCIREAPEDHEEAAALRARDVHDLAAVLLQALTQSRTLVSNGHTLLPKPFDQIIRNGIAGTWTLDQIAATLTPPTVSPLPKPAARVANSAAVVAIPPVSSPPDVSGVASAASSASAASTSETAQFTTHGSKPLSRSVSPDQATLPLADYSPSAVAASLPPAAAHRSAPRPARAALDRVKLSLEADPKRKRLWIACSVAILVVLAALGWRSFHPTPDRPIVPISDMGSVPVGTAPVLTKPLAASTHGKPPASTQPSHSQPTNQPVAAPNGQPQWRVVAFTYNREDQAWQKAAALGRQHSFLRPEVFTPTGHAPFLVTVGGAMTREQAFAFKQKARNAGLPRDLYAQNYTGRSR